MSRHRAAPGSATAGRRSRRWTALLAALAMLLAAMALAAPAAAQTSTVLVGNNDKADAGPMGFNRDRGQPFTTGSNSEGYRLTSVDIASNVTLASVSNWEVSIAAAGSSGPGSKLSGGTLNAPTGLTTGIGNSFTASGDGVDLAANTTYYIFIDLAAENSTAFWKSTTDDGENANPATGWSIGDTHYVRVVGSTGAWGQLSTHNLKLRINGYAKVAPAVTSAAINGATLDITFGNDLDTTSGTAASRFTINAGGSSHTATGISISARQVRLTVPTVASGQTVTVSYSKPTSNPLKGTTGADVASFSNQAVTNNTLPPPVVTAAVINGDTLVLSFDRDLDTTSNTPANRFTIEVGGRSYAATGITISTRQVRLTVPAVKAGQFVTVSYSQPGSNRLRGDSADVAPFTNHPLTNNTPAPQVAGGTVRAPITVTEGGETIEIRALSAERGTLLDYFEDECQRTGQGTRFGSNQSCASHKLYVRNSQCSSEDWRSRNGHILATVCPDQRTW